MQLLVTEPNREASTSLSERFAAIKKPEVLPLLLACVALYPTLRKDNVLYKGKRLASFLLQHNAQDDDSSSQFFRQGVRQGRKCLSRLLDAA